MFWFQTASTRVVSWFALLTAAGLMAACGGGGDDDPSARDPLPTLSQDILPPGTRIDRIASDHFADQAGNTWTYDSTDSLGGGVMVVTRTITAGAGGDLQIMESDAGDVTTETWRRTAEGLLLIDPLADAGIGSAGNVLASLLEYPEPFYPVGAERRLIRQGSLGADLTGDGLPDSFRFEYAQVLVGFETVTLPSGPLPEVAHFRNVISIRVQPSDIALDPITVVGTEHAWWAPGIGLVRAERSVVDGDGVAVGGVQTLVLTGGMVRGRELFLPEPDGTVTTIALSHRALVYDATRNRYYASVPGSVPVGGNSIATIDPATGAVSTSAPVGSEPSALALSADGSVLYVGLDGSGDVLRLRLPDMQELGRTRLPLDAFYGQLLADRMTVSPADPGVVAVAMLRVGVSPRHAGVALVRNDVLQPLVTQDHTGSNVVAFGADGTSVYGFNNESTEFGLRRLAVLANGLQETLVVTAVGGNFAPRDIELSPQGVLLGRELYRVPDLALQGRYGTDGGGLCRWHTASARVVCLGVLGAGEDRFLTVADPVSFVTLATPVFQPGYGLDDIAQIVPGPRGQVALRIGTVYVSNPAGTIWLFTTPALD
jgi:hypothetical protein